MASEFDHGYKLLFSHAEMVRDLLTGFVHEPWVQELQFDTLQRVSASYVSDDPRDREGDIVWRVRFQDRWLYLYILLEFQSQPDRFMAVRMLGYVSLLYQDLIRQGPQAWRPEVNAGGSSAAASTAPASGSGSTRAASANAPANAPAVPLPQRLPPVLPIVLYNGRWRWNAATEVAELIEPPPGRLARFTPQLRYLLLDEGALDESVPLSLRNLAAALFRLEKSFSSDTMREVVGSLVRWLTAPQQDSLRRAFAVYIAHVLLPARAPGLQTLPVANLLEVQTMLEETVLDWRRQWLEEGLALGKAEGLAQGMVEGKLTTLTRQLNRRFGPLPSGIAERLQTASVAQLDDWADRVLDAHSLEDIFAEP